MTPYCQHPECHDTRTNSYARTGTNGALNPTAFWGHVPGCAILCRIHALHKFGIAVG